MSISANSLHNKMRDYEEMIGYPVTPLKAFL